MRSLLRSGWAVSSDREKQQWLDEDSDGNTNRTRDPAASERTYAPRDIDNFDRGIPGYKGESTPQIEPPDGTLASAQWICEHSRWKLWVCFAGCTVLAALTTCLTKFMFTMPVDENCNRLTGCRTGEFRQPTFVALLTFMGQAMCIAMYWFIKVKERRRMILVDDASSLGGKWDTDWTTRGDSNMASELTVDEHASAESSCSPWWWRWVVLAFLNFVGSVLCNAGLLYTHILNATILRQILLPTTLIIQICVSQRVPLNHEIIGAFVVLMSVILIIISTLADDTDSYTDHDLRTAIGLIMAGTFVHSLETCWEGHLFSIGKTPMLLAVGIQGLAGMYFAAAVLPVLEEAGWESTIQGFRLMSESNTLAALVAVYIVAVFLMTLLHLKILTETEAQEVDGNKWYYSVILLKTLIIWLAEIVLIRQTFEVMTASSVVLFVVGYSLSAMLVWDKVFPTEVRRFMFDPAYCGWRSHKLVR